MLSHDTIATDDELPRPGKKKHRKHSFLGACLRIFFILFFIVVISISSQVTYDYTRYQSFYVNGESMYPTLNKDVTYTLNGETHYGSESNPVYDWGEFNISGATYQVDYGLMDDKPGFIDRLNYFDIVVTYYNSDMTYDEASGSYQVREGADEKIKRLMAKPGDSYRFDSEGNFYRNDVLVEQTFLAEAEAEVPGWIKATYNATLPFLEGTLGADEYYVCGDNRLSTKKSGTFNIHSLDSRSAGVGPIKEHCLQGRAVAIIGSYPYKAGQSSESKFNQLIRTHFRMPWDLKSLI
jgi:signal peptidase I